MSTKPNNRYLTSASALVEEYRLLHGSIPDALNEESVPEQIRLQFLWKQIHSLPEKRAALCLSGGGARSATFSLGVLRALARLRLLDKFDYLSTVSGGGYIGGWLSTWIHRHPHGLRGVMEDLSTDAQNSSAREPFAVSWLRNYCSYLGLSPRLFSADSWTVVVTYLSNLILNWTLLFPIFMIPLLVPRMVIALAQLNTPDAPLPSWLFHAVLTISLGLTVIALIYLHTFRPTLSKHRRSLFWQRLEGQNSFINACLLPLITSMSGFTVAWAWFRNGGGILEQFSYSQAVLGGAVLHTGSWLFSAFMLKRFNVSRWLLLENVTVALTGALGGWLLLNVLKSGPKEIPIAHYAGWFACFAIPGLLAIVLMILTIFTGIASRFAQEEDLEWWERMKSWLFVILITWTLLSAVVVFGPGFLAWFDIDVFSVIATLSGIMILWLRFNPKHAARREVSESPLTMWIEQLPTIITPIFMLILLLYLVLGCDWILESLARQHQLHLSDTLPKATGLGMLPDPWNHEAILHNTPHWLIGETILVLSAFGLLMSRTVNINKLSLDALYRNRLIRAYLGASRQRSEREALFNQFTGFDPHDNVAMCNLRFDDIRLARALYKDHLSDSTLRILERCRASTTSEDQQEFTSLLLRDIQRLYDEGVLADLAKSLLLSPASIERLETLAGGTPDPGSLSALTGWLRDIFLNRLEAVAPRPLHVINIALDLVTGHNIAWQNRKTRPFTVSPLHCGNMGLGYRPSEDYGGSTFLNKSLSLGTALTISGVPRISSTGSDTSGLTNLLFTIFNLRSGWWLSNPGPAGDRTYRHPSPTLAFGPFIAEAFGMTDASYPYVNLSAGENFESLGLYEMVFRRCHSILVVDSTSDPGFTFGELSNSIHKIRSVLGIDIELDLTKLHQQTERGVSQWHHAIGKIRYDKADDTALAGTLIYLKPSLTSDEPSNISEYAARHRGFPHEIRTDAYLNDTQFEYYSQLGEHIAWEVLFPARHKTSHGFAAVCDELWSYWMSPTRNWTQSFQPRYVRPK